MDVSSGRMQHNSWMFIQRMEAILKLDAYKETDGMI